MPIDRVIRSGNDIVVAFDVNDVDVEAIRNTLITEAKEEEAKLEAEKALDAETKAIINSVKNNSSLSLMDKIRLAKAQGEKILIHKFNSEDTESELLFDNSYYSILSRTFSLMNHAMAKNAADRYKPEVLVKMPFDAYGDIGDYAKAREISGVGRELMSKALDKYESGD